jgi:acetyltransferase-like isoleucine patch superfamily enzyme
MRIGAPGGLDILLDIVVCPSDDSKRFPTHGGDRMGPRAVAKWLARAAAHVAATPVLLVHALKVPVLGKDRALEGSTQLLALLPGVSGQYIRRAFLAWTVAECHPSATICFGTILSKTAIRIGENAYIGPFCSLGSVTVENDVLVATGVHILSGARMHGTAELGRPIRAQPRELAHVTIGAGSWIGAGTVVMADIGRDSVVGAGAVVTKPLADAVVAAGVPAKVIRARQTDSNGEPGA